jgi:hypothetical protein
VKKKLRLGAGQATEIAGEIRPAVKLALSLPLPRVWLTLPSAMGSDASDLRHQ